MNDLKPLTDDELIHFGQLLKEEEQDLIYESLEEFDNLTNPNYKLLHQSVVEQEYNENDELIAGARGVLLEGSTRSGKTWSGVDLIIYICKYIETNCTINIYRETYNEFKTTLYDDFRRRLDDYGLPNKFKTVDEIKSFRIGNNKINFLGDGKEGGGCDYAFFNEIMHISERVFDSVEQRCRKFWWADYNPSFTDHWVFNRIQPRPDVKFLRTTFLVNPYITPQEKNKVLAYEPWKPGSYVVTDSGDILYKGSIVTDRNQPPKHPTNWANGTANEYKWRVYGLGLRGSMKGVIFKQLEWIDDFPDIAFTYANDFGFTSDPNALVKYAEDENNIWFEVLYYDPVETDKELDAIFESLEIRRNTRKDLKDGDLITCDSSDKYTGENKGTIEMVRGLRNRGWLAKKVKKTKSNIYWLNSMREKKIHCVKNHNWKHVKRERENYKFKEVQGIQINQPEDKFNHIFDAVKYGHIAHNSKGKIHRTTKSLKELGVNW